MLNIDKYSPSNIIVLVFVGIVGMPLSHSTVRVNIVTKNDFRQQYDGDTTRWKTDESRTQPLGDETLLSKETRKDRAGFNNNQEVPAFEMKTS